MNNMLTYAFFMKTLKFFIGWVKFALKNLSNIQTDKWHTAYYGTKLGAIRRILDKGQPLTKGTVFTISMFVK